MLPNPPKDLHVPMQPAIEQITPNMSFGSIGGYVVLAHIVQSDSAVVNGYDLMKLHQNTLNYLSRQEGANQADIREIVTKSMADKLYTVKPPQNPQPSGGSKP